MNRLLLETFETNISNSRDKEFTLLRINLVLESFSPYVTVNNNVTDDLLYKDTKYEEITAKYIKFEDTNIPKRYKLTLKGDDGIHEISDKRLFLIRSGTVDKNSVIVIYKEYEDGLIIRDFLDRNGYNNVEIFFLNKMTRDRMIEILISKDRQRIIENKLWLSYYLDKYAVDGKDLELGKYFIKLLDTDYSDSNLIQFTAILERVFNQDRDTDESSDEPPNLTHVSIEEIKECIYTASESYAIEYVLDTAPCNVSNMIYSEIDKNYQERLREIPLQVLPENDRRIYKMFFQNIIPNLTVNVGLDYNSLISHDFNTVINNSLARIEAIIELSEISLVPIIINYKRNGFITIKRQFPIRTETEKRALISKWSKLFATKIYPEMQDLLLEMSIPLPIKKEKMPKRSNVPDFVSCTGKIRIQNPQLEYTIVRVKDGTLKKRYRIAGGPANINGKDKTHWIYPVKECDVEKYSKLYGPPIQVCNKESQKFFEIIDLSTKKRLVEILETKNIDEFTRNRKAFKICLIKYFTLMNYKLCDYKTVQILRNNPLKQGEIVTDKFIDLFKRIINRDFLSEIPENILEMPIRDRFPYYGKQYLKNKEYDIVYWQGIV